jgi:YesN/AraC family two-component response regulator
MITIGADGHRGLVNTESDMEIVAEASDGAQALSCLKSIKPDLVLMDSRMTVKTGIEATIEICKKRDPKARVSC